MTAGIIYILTNQAMPGYVKVGKSSDPDVTARIRSLNNTSVPFDFECYYAARVADCDTAERQIHDAFMDHRPNPRREFFTIDPERVRSALRLAELEDVTPEADDIIPDRADRVAVENTARRKRNTTLNDIGIMPGEVLVLDRDQDTTCEVVNHRQVLFCGETMSLSKSAHQALTALGYDWPAANGWAIWTYGGRRLAELVDDHVADD